MATLSADDLTAVWAQWMQVSSSIKEPMPGVLKADVLAAVTALDSFMNTNAGAVNNAIPLPARTALTTAQKARMLMFVIEQRYVKGA